MLIGLKALLAIEYELVPSVGHAILGHFCMWANNRMIGNYADIVVLTAVQGHLEDS